MRSGGRLYWVCQGAGWGSFLAYVLIGYFATAESIHASDVVSIVFFNGLVCPALTHGLRHWMHDHGWLDLPFGHLSFRLSAVVVAAAATLTGGVALWVFLCGSSLPPSGLIAIFAGFCWGFAGWVVIYYAVHARRRRDALQLELRVVAREAQLQALRAQLNPHFLFNCLNSLRHLTLSNPERAAAMVTGLSELLRYSLASDHRNLVPLSDELRIVDEYLELERVRLEERLRVERAVDPAALAVMVPPMLIQSLVENAIKHGISELPAGGVVRIEAGVAGPRVQVTITNTGGLKPTAAENGQGLRNARERLRLLYDGAASLDLRETAGSTQAALIVPMEVATERTAG